MLSRIDNSAEKGPDILVVDSSYHGLHRLKNMLYQGVPNATINGYVPTPGIEPGKKMQWQRHELLMLDACACIQKEYKQLETLSQTEAPPYTVMLTDPSTMNEVQQAGIPGVSKYLAREDVTTAMLTRIVKEAAKCNTHKRNRTQDIPNTAQSGRPSTPTHTLVDEPPFTHLDISSGAAEIQGYSILQLIGIGGMSSAYLAERKSDKMQVVLKILKPNLLVDDIVIDRFIKEYHIAKNIRHKNVVEIHDQRFTDEFAYIVMQYLPGKCMKEVTRYAINPRSAVRYSLDITSALSAIHEAGIVHRDIKPGNFTLDQHGRVVLLDFGVCKRIGENHELTRHGEAIGTPQFMSPEQVFGKDVDERSDLYALGVMMYKMITGQYPFKANTAVELMYKNAYTQAPELPYKLLGLEEIIHRLLEKDPDDRYQSANAVYDDLVSFLMKNDRLIGDA